MEMNIKDFEITTEQVSKYHPDKYADQISDKIVQYVKSNNNSSKVAVETMVKDDVVVLAGEISGYKLKETEAIRLVNEVANDLGYKCSKVINLIGEQSEQIRHAVEQDDIGAGDQGIIFGYATKGTPKYLPIGHYVANKIIKLIERQVKVSDVFKGDAKTQVTEKNGKISKVVVSVCHDSSYSVEYVRKRVSELLNTIDELSDAEYIINPAGTWTIGGPTADAGLTGRKIVADQYGGYMKVGGGAFSGKDLTKVDRSAAYIAYIVATEIVKEGKYDVDWVKIQVGYAIGRAMPVSLTILSDKGVIDNTPYINRFRVKNMLKELEGIDLYSLAGGCHFEKLWDTIHG